MIKTLCSISICTANVKCICLNGGNVVSAFVVVDICAAMKSREYW